MPGPPERDHWPTESWRVAGPETQGLDGTSLQKIDEYARASLPPIRAVVVVRGGHVVFEAYYDGASQDTYHTVNSVTKSVISMLIGIALRDGLIASVEQPILALLPDYDTPDLDARTRNLTVRHLLTMTGGFEHHRSDHPIPLDSDDIVRS